MFVLEVLIFLQKDGRLAESEKSNIFQTRTVHSSYYQYVFITRNRRNHVLQSTRSRVTAAVRLTVNEST